MDLVYLGLALALWAAIAGLAVACARLEPSRSAGRAQAGAGSPPLSPPTAMGGPGAAQTWGRS